MISKDCVKENTKGLLKSCQKNRASGGDCVAFVFYVCCENLWARSSAILNLEREVDSGGHADKQDTDSAVYYLDNQPDSTNNSNNSFPSASTLADDLD